MKDFCNWLGVNEKIAKLVVWFLIFMCVLIILNTSLESVGLPYYKVTMENISKIETNVVIDYLLNWLMILLDFYAMVFIIFRTKNFKKVFPYSILYLISNILISEAFGSLIIQLFIPLYVIGFMFYYSGKKWKYILYGFLTYSLSSAIQYICYLYKLKFIDITKLDPTIVFLLSIDYFIIMLTIIIIKEIVVKRKEIKSGRKSYVVSNI